MIELVSHVYNPPGTDQYAQLFKWQLASLANYPPLCEWRLTVCCAKDDKALESVFLGFCRAASVAAQNVQLLYLPHAQLFRRAIGRNIRAKRTTADVIWFTDCDYAFGEGCLDYVVEHVMPWTELVMPKQCRISYDVAGRFPDAERPHHETGNAAIERERDNPLPLLMDGEFMPRIEKRAIGGLQIIGGCALRRLRYLDGTRWVEPVDPALGFRSCRCDAAWRRHNNLQAKRLPIPNVYRLRHLSDGRDMNEAGELVGKECW